MEIYRNIIGTHNNMEVVGKNLFQPYFNYISTLFPGVFLLIFVFIIIFLPLKSEAGTIAKPPYMLGLSSGLVGHWTFDGKDTTWTGETTGTTADISGNGNTGTLTNMNIKTAPTRGKIGQGFLFDDTDDYIRIVDLSEPFETGDFAISLWEKNNLTDANGSSRVLFSNFNEGTDSLEIGWLGAGTYDEQFYITAYNNSSVQKSAISLQNDIDTDWHNLVGMFDGTNLILYKDGVYQSTTDLLGTIKNGANAFEIGHSSFSNYWDGNIDDVRVYNRVLSASEIGQLYNFGAAKLGVTSKNSLDDGLVGHWTFDGKDTTWTGETTGTTADISGNGNTGTLTNMNIKTAPTRGKIGQGLWFDGVDSNVTITDDSEIEGLTTMSVSAWVKSSVPNKASGANYIVADLNVSSFEFFWDQGENVLFRIYNDAAGSAYGQFTDGILDTDWHFVTGVYDGSTIKVYVDGIVGGTVGNFSDPIKTFSSTLRLSYSYSAWNGIIDDVRIYNRALSESEIGQLYNMGKGLTLHSPLYYIKNGMISWMDFDADGSDSHASYDFITYGTPTYSGGAGNFDTSNHVYSSDTWEAAVGSGEADFTWAAWVHTDPSQIDLEWLQRGQQSKSEFRYSSASNYPMYKIFGIGGSSNYGGMTTDTDYLIGVEWNSNTNTAKAIVNGDLYGSVSGASTGLDSLFRLCSSNTTGSQYYWFGSWNRKLTADELRALYKAGPNLTYSDLP